MRIIQNDEGYRSRRSARWAPLMLALVWLATGCPASAAASAATSDPLPSWADGEVKRNLMRFVMRVSTPGPDFVPQAQRIAVFDNDGTLWPEQPAYVQLLFAMDRVRELAPQHPEWKTQQPFKAVLEHDMNTLAASGERGLLQLVMATHAGMSVRAYRALVRDWLKRARHPRYGRLYTELVYQPMLELLQYLRAHGFKTYIVSGGGIEFIRVFAEKVYGIPPEQVIGSSIETRFEMRKQGPVLVRMPKIAFIDDGDGKPVAINWHIGRRPIAAFGNSDGDLPMLQWSCSGDGPHFCLYVHHTDAKREWAYDRDSHIGRLKAGLEVAARQGWSVVDMRKDWRVIFPAGKRR